jgi:hypothetical protein
VNRYLVFSGDAYYPEGGWNDFKLACATLEEGLAFVARHPADWWHVFDTTTLVIVRHQNSPHDDDLDEQSSAFGD